MILFIFAPPSYAEETYPMSTSTVTHNNAHQFSFQSIDGDDMPLSGYKGRIILVVNTASQCGLTGQYKALQEIHNTYKDKGLIVLGVPSADFGGQEFAMEEKVKSFTEEKFNVTFPLTSISKVKGGEAHPFYVWAKNEAGLFGAPKWNFHKYLIDHNGDFIMGFASTTSPTATKVKKAIENALNNIPTTEE